MMGKPFGIPIAAIGLVGFAILYAMYLKNNRYFGISLTAAFLASIVFVYAQAIIYQQFCPYCITVESLVAVLWIYHLYNKQHLTTGLLTTVAIYSTIAILTVSINYIENNTYKYVDELANYEPPIIHKTPDSQQHNNNQSVSVIHEDTTSQKLDNNQSVSVVHEDTTSQELSAPKEFKEESPASTDNIVFYDQYRNPVKIDNGKSILYVASWCKACDKALEQASIMNDIIVVDTAINIPESEEIVAMQKKANPYNIDIYYDFDDVCTVKRFPTWAKNNV
jgi:thiol-disulfide isomerase/thioredoxin